MSHLLRWATFVSLAGAVCLLTATPALAKTIHVHPGQSIQAAINAAKPGDTIVVDAGVYHENLVITKDRLQLEGAGPGATVLVTPATPNPVPPQCGSSTVFHGICVAGAFDAAGNPGDPVKGVQIEGFSVLGFPGFGILDLNAKDSTVENVEAASNASYGISGALLNGISYFGNVSHDNGEPGVYVGDSPRAHAAVVGNTPSHNGAGGHQG